MGDCNGGVVGKGRGGGGGGEEDVLVMRCSPTAPADI